jgi:hypothetical protein
MNYKNEVLRMFNQLPDGKYEDVLAVSMLLTACVFDAGERKAPDIPKRIEAMPMMDTMRGRYRIIIEEVDSLE